MIDQEKLELYARLKAVETVLSFALAMAYKADKIRPGGVPELHDFLMAVVSQQSVSGTDPATADLLISEVSEAMKTILDRAAALHEGISPTGQRPAGS